MLRHIWLHVEYLRVAINTALEYRINFIIQVLSMMINDLIWIIFWLLFFNKFSAVGGWNFSDVIVMYAVITMAYGISGFLFGNRNYVASVIVEGRLDFYLTLPKNILHHLLISKSAWYDLGDMMFGILLSIIFIPVAKFPLLLVLVMFSAIIFTTFSVIAGSLAFYLGNSEQLTKTLLESVVGLSSYPINIYKGFTRILIFFVIPAGFISGVPVELLRQFNILWFIYLIGFTILITAVSIAVFYYGLKKYESGNLLYVRM